VICSDQWKELDAYVGGSDGGKGTMEGRELLPIPISTGGGEISI